MAGLNRNPTAEEAYREIIDVIIPNVTALFLRKTMDYDSGPAFQFLGVKGQFGDLNRKFWKLYKALWLDEDLVGEQPIEILHDLIGHCLLTIWLLQQEENEARAKDRKQIQEADPELARLIEEEEEIERQHVRRNTDQESWSPGYGRPKFADQIHQARDYDR